MKKTAVIILLSVIAVVFAALYYSARYAKQPGTGITSLEEIRKLREFHVISYRYQDLFYYHNKQDKGSRVLAIVSMPVSLRAYFDMSETLFEETDSNLRITLPQPELTEPSFHFEGMQTHQVRRFTVMAGVDIHQRMLESIRDKLDERKEYVIFQARQSGIREMAVAQASEYFSNLFRDLGYDSVIIDVAAASIVDDSSAVSGPALIGLDGIRVIEPG